MKNFHTDHLDRGYMFPGLLPARQALKGFASFQGRLAFSLFALLACGAVWGQAPERFSHQAVVRDMSDNLIASQAVGVQITILQGAPNGANMYRERHSATTNAAGLLSLEIGGGAVQNGSLSAINWSAGPYYLEQAIDPTGGTNYTLSETNQLVSVPYALYAQSAERANSAAIADFATNVSSAGQSGVPIGMIVPYSGPAGSVPSGWLLCDGTSYDVNIYPELFALIGTAYGSDPNRFKVPDLRGRNPMGRDANQAEFAALGQTGGAKTHTLTIAEMPAHNHGGVTGSAGSHQHTYGTRGFGTGTAGGTITSSALGMDGSTDDQDAFTQFAGEHPHAIPSAGAGSPHNNLQPYLTLNFIIKAR